MQCRICASMEPRRGTKKGLRPETSLVGEYSRQLETEAGSDHMLKAVFERLRNAGNRFTGGGARELAKRVLKASLHRATEHPRLVAIGRSILRPFPVLAANLERLASRLDAPSAQTGFLPFGNTTDPDSLPASARIIYSRLQKAISEGKVPNRGAR
jgi:hypothetical protein